MDDLIEKTWKVNRQRKQNNWSKISTNYFANSNLNLLTTRNRDDY